MSSVDEELTKSVTENIRFNMDFTKRLATGESISNLDSVVSVSQSKVEGSDNVTIGSTSISNNIIQVRLSAGTQYEQYEITITVTTSDTNVKVGTGLLRIT